MEDRTLMSNFVVSNTDDGGPGSLRQAILDSNAAIGGASTIDFHIAGSGVRTISPQSPLPAIGRPVLIDGDSQPGFARRPLIQVSGGLAGGGDGLVIASPGVIVRGLDINDFAQGAGIHLAGPSATGDRIQGDFVGIDPSGKVPAPDAVGVEIDGGAHGNLIGSDDVAAKAVAERDLISGNTFANVSIAGPGTYGNVVAGDFIGTSITGKSFLNYEDYKNYYSPDGSKGIGVVIQRGASGNTIGGTSDATVDLISGNVGDGVVIEGRGTIANVVEGDLIGTSVSGHSSLSNGAGVFTTGPASGVVIQGAATGNTVGGTANGAGDVISGNTYDGVVIQGAGTDANLVEGDMIGTSVSGDAIVPNGGGGDEYDMNRYGGRGLAILYGAAANTVGGTTTAARNVISGNYAYGVDLSSGALANVIEGNDIGTDATGQEVLPNDRDGVFIDAGAGDNTIGGATGAAGNLIRGNREAGVVVDATASTGNVITAGRIYGNAQQDIEMNQGPALEVILAADARGGLEAWLDGGEPDRTYRVDVYADAGYGAGRLGVAEDWMGTLDVTTDSNGQATFPVPYVVPAGLPAITATATAIDLSGNTSAIADGRLATLATPTGIIRATPDAPTEITRGDGGSIAIEDPGAGPLVPQWYLTLHATTGSLTLATTAGLTGTGDGTDSLSYSGTAAALNAALVGLTFTPGTGFHGDVTMTLFARSTGTATIKARVALQVETGRFLVTSTADGGPGSLRRAILDSDATPGATNTIAFDIPGTGVRTIRAASPLPAITAPVVLDGTTQPGYAGVPLIAVDGQGAEDAEPLTIGADATIKGLALDGYDFASVKSSTTLAVESAPFDGTPGDTVTGQIVVAKGEDLVATAQGLGVTTSLVLLDARGHIVAQSDGASPSEPVDAIDIYIGPGTYTLEARGGDGGTVTLTTMLMPSASPLRPVTLEGTPGVMAVGDFNGDGRPDLAVVDETSDGTPRLAILPGNGDGSFQTAVYYKVAFNPTAILAGDFNGDGHLDLAIADNGDDVSIRMGNGDGTFRPAVDYPVGDDPMAMVAGDFNGDGKLDLAVVDGADADVAILMGNGNGTFRPAEHVAAGIDPVAIASGDFDGDGHLDLAVAYQGTGGDSTGSTTGGVDLLIGDGDGTFQPPVAYPLGTAPVAVLAGDFNRDDRPDLAVADNNADNVAVLLGRGDGTLAPAVDYPVPDSPVALVSGDFDGDGKLDLAVTTGGFQDDVSILMGVGDGTFQAVVNDPIEGTPDAMVAGDFNGDGHLDLAVSEYSPDGVAIVLGNGTGIFTGLSPVSVDALSAATVADLNGDGTPDLAVVSAFDDTLSILIGDGDGVFQPAVDYPVGIGAIDVVSGDFNGDGRLDLAVLDEGDQETGGSQQGGIDVLMGNGDGTFLPPVHDTLAGDLIALVAGDFMGDGRLGLAALDQGNEDIGGTDPGGVYILAGNGDGTFRPAVDVALGERSTGDAISNRPTAMVAGDFDGDGRLDLAVTFFDGELSVLLGDGGGTFHAHVFEEPVSIVDGLVAGDFDGDGRLDLALEGDGEVSILMGDGDGTFQPTVSYPIQSDPDEIVAGDFEGNGILDLAIGYEFGGGTSILMGNGDGTFQAAIDDTAGAGLDPLAVGDFIGGGGSDLVVSEAYGAALSIVAVKPDGTVSTPTPADTTPEANPLVADVNGDGTDDVLVVDDLGDILYRQGIPGKPGSFEPPVTVNAGRPSRDIAWVPDTLDGPLLASVDARDDGVSLFADQDGSFVLVRTLATGQLPGQVMAADLTGDGWDDLVVRNAGDGTLSVFDNNGRGSFWTGFYDPFLPAITIAIGQGISDVQAVDTTGDGQLDLVVANDLTGHVDVLDHEGHGRFAAPVPYRAGTAPLEVAAGSATEVAGVDGTIGVAAGPLAPGGFVGLVTINPGSSTIDILAGLGGGRFANPATIPTRSPAEIVRMADFNGDGIADLAVLSPAGMGVYLGDGRGGFVLNRVYPVPPQADGLTVADLTRDGQLDLLVGDAYGDMLNLMGEGDGTFQPYRQADQTIALAVADLDADGLPDFVYADQGLDQVAVDRGSDSAFTVLADQSMGLLQPGALVLADLNGDGIPDVIVANSGSNNVLIYPGLGKGRFGTAINGGNGYFVGTNPVGITAADLTGKLPDLVVADAGSNQVSVLLNTSQPGGPITFEEGPRLSSGGTGPVSTMVGHFTGGVYPDLLVTNQGSNDVALLKGVGPGFFDDRAPRIYPVGTKPMTSFVGNFDGQPDLVTVNADSNDLTLISGFEGSSPVVSTIASGGVDPATAFMFSAGGAFDDLVVGNEGDGALALFEGSQDGLDLVSVEEAPDLPDPTSLSFSSLTGGAVAFYAASAGHEAADLVALSLSAEVGTGPGSLGGASGSGSGSDASSSSTVQLVGLHDSSLPLVATLLTLTLEMSGEGGESVSSESEGAGVFATVGGAGLSSGQGALKAEADGVRSGEESEATEEEVGAEAAGLAPWERYVLKLEAALEDLEREWAGEIAAPFGPIDGAAPSAGPEAPEEAGGSGLQSVLDRPSGAESEDAGASMPDGRTGAADGAIPRVQSSWRSASDREIRAEVVDAAIARLEADRAGGESGAIEPLFVRVGQGATILQMVCLAVSFHPQRSSVSRRRDGPLALGHCGIPPLPAPVPDSGKRRGREGIV